MNYLDFELLYYGEISPMARWLYWCDTCEALIRATITVTNHIVCANSLQKQTELLEFANSHTASFLQGIAYDLALYGEGDFTATRPPKERSLM